eukprot:6950498-Pyramimonas_sp.AAC.1
MSLDMMGVAFARWFVRTHDGEAAPSHFFRHRLSHSEEARAHIGGAHCMQIIIVDCVVLVAAVQDSR